MTHDRYGHEAIRLACEFYDDPRELEDYENDLLTAVERIRSGYAAVVAAAQRQQDDHLTRALARYKDAKFNADDDVADSHLVAAE